MLVRMCGAARWVRPHRISTAPLTRSVRWQQCNMLLVAARWQGAGGAVVSSEVGCKGNKCGRGRGDARAGWEPRRGEAVGWGVRLRGLGADKVWRKSNVL
eukprot:5460338-Prorocentrum_lima.AAC.1